jgi:methionine synthase II (cobalamin-independent)
MDKITPSTSIEEIVEVYPELVRPLREYGIKCIACGEPVWGTLEENARLKGIENIEEIALELNKLIEETHHV